MAGLLVKEHSSAYILDVPNAQFIVKYSSRVLVRNVVDEEASCGFCFMNFLIDGVGQSFNGAELQYDAVGVLKGPDYL